VGAVAYGVKENGFAYFLLFYYSQVLGLRASLAGAALMIALLLDAVSDPLVGYVSDHWHSRMGRRHPFMYSAALPLALCYALLWNPPRDLESQALFLYLLGFAVLVRTLITLYEIPNTSLVAELTEDYDERTRLVSYRYFFGWFGGLAMAGLAYTVFLRTSSANPDGVLYADGYRAYGIAAAALILLSVVTSAGGTHRYIPDLKPPPERRHLGVHARLGELRETLSNRSFQALFWGGLFAAMAAGFSAALNLYLVTYFWGLSPEEIRYFILLNFFSAALAAVLAARFTSRFDKRQAAVGLFAFSIFFGSAPVLLRLVGFFPGNDHPVLLPLLLSHNFIEVAVVVMVGIAISSMVADIAEENELRTGRREEGLFFAARSFAAKATTGVGTFLAGLALETIGLEAGARPADVAPSALVRLGIIFGPALMVLYLIALACVSRYQISRTGHAEHIELLAQRRSP